MCACMYVCKECPRNTRTTSYYRFGEKIMRFNKIVKKVVKVNFLYIVSFYIF